MTDSNIDDQLEELVEQDAHAHRQMSLADLYRKAKDMKLIKPHAQYT